MLRSGRANSLARSALRSKTLRGTRSTSRFTPQTSKPLIPHGERLKRLTTLALTAYRPLSTSLQRYATTPAHPESPYDAIDKKHEESVGKEELEPHPEEVSTASSVHQVFEEKGVPDTEKDEDMLAGVYSDIVRHHPPALQRLIRQLIQCLRKPSKRLSPSMKSLAKPFSSV